MKNRNGFVSNSSSSSFIIKNKSNNKLTLVDFVNENPQLIQDWNDNYEREDSQYELLMSAEDNNITFDENSSKQYTFGDEDGTLIGRVFDYILRDGGSSENFHWKFHKYYR